MKLAPAALLLLAGCGGPSKPAPPEEGVQTLLLKFRPAAAAYSETVGEEFADNALDPDALHRSAGFEALAAASQKLLPGFPIREESREPLAHFAVYLGGAAEVADWKVSLHHVVEAAGTAIAALEPPADEFGSTPFYLRLERDKKKRWQVASWPPQTREAMQTSPIGVPILHLGAWDAGEVPDWIRATVLKEFGAEIPAGAGFAQVVWKRKILYHSLPAGGNAADPWQRLASVVQDLWIPGATSSGGLPDEPLLIYSEPGVRAALLLDLLGALARPECRWPKVWLASPGPVLDAFRPLDQSLAWSPPADAPIVDAGGSEDDWTAALRDAPAGAPVGLRIAPELEIEAAAAALDRLQARGRARVFLVLPAQG